MDISVTERIEDYKLQVSSLPSCAFEGGGAGIARCNALPPLSKDVEDLKQVNDIRTLKEPAKYPDTHSTKHV